MELMIASEQQNGDRSRRPNDKKAHRESVGPAFFASRSVSDIRHCSAEDLKQLGSIPFPFAYCNRTDRYEAKVWDDVIWQVANAISRCGIVSIVGEHPLKSELETLRILFHDCTGKFVESFQNDTASTTSISEQENRAKCERERVIIAVGSVRTGDVSGDFEKCTTLFLSEHLVPPMFEGAGPKFILPLTAGGWRISHIAFRRLLDIERGLYDEREFDHHQDCVKTFARPLCEIVCELLRKIKLMSDHSQKHG